MYAGSQRDRDRERIGTPASAEGRTSSLNPLGWDAYVVVCAFSSQAIGFAFRFTACRDRRVRKRVAKPYGERLKGLMAEKSHVLSQAQAFADMGLEETARPLWSCAASYEERIAPLLDGSVAMPRRRSHRVSAAVLLREVPATGAVRPISTARRSAARSRVRPERMWSEGSPPASSNSIRPRSSRYLNRQALPEDDA